MNKPVGKIVAKGPSIEDQLDELKQMVGQVDRNQRVLDLSKVLTRCLTMILKHSVVSIETLYAAMYYDKLPEDRPDQSAVGAHLFHLRKWLYERDVKLHTRVGEGYYLTDPDKKKINGWIAGEEIKFKETLAKGYINDEKITIEKNIPLPSRYATHVKYPFAQMEPGDSFFSTRGIQTMAKAIHYFREKHPTWKFASRRAENGKEKGTRVWRVE